MENNKAFDQRRVVVVGAGSVGATYCYALAQSGLADEIVLIDKNTDLVKGQVLDLSHGQPFFPSVIIRAGSPDDYTDAQLVVVTAGAAQKDGAESRLQLLKKNAEIIREIAREVAEKQCQGVLLIVSNPVDVLTYVALKETGWVRGRVIGSGTVLDSARFRYLISQHCKVDVHSVHAYILGEHGDSEFAAWSMTNVGGIGIDEYTAVCDDPADWPSERGKMEEMVRKSAYHIINYKGSTHFGVGMALVRISEAILRNQRSVLSVSSFVDGEYGLKDLCISLPCIVDEGGVNHIISGKLTHEEQQSLEHSAQTLKDAIQSLNEK